MAGRWWRTRPGWTGSQAGSPVPHPQAAACGRPAAHREGRARLRAGLAAGDPGGEVAAAWQGKELLRAVYAADLADARAALDRFYRWADGVRIPELSRLARTVRTWEAEILAFHT